MGDKGNNYIVKQDLETHTLNRRKLILPFFVRYIDDIELIALTNKIDSILNMFKLLQITIYH